MNRYRLLNKLFRLLRSVKIKILVSLLLLVLLCVFYRNYSFGIERKYHFIKVKTEKKAKNVFSDHRIVHLDLKGAPPRVSYYRSFFRFIQILGATGVLIEYEDMFPYSIDVSAKNSYSIDDIKEILKYAKESSLEVIPLIQTFGHLEFVLKLDQFKQLREVYESPQTICPLKIENYKILTTMIDDIVRAHEGIRFLHIGFDDVSQLGKCEQCKQMLSKFKINKNRLFLSHLTTIANYVKDNYPDVTLLVWDDQLRSLSVIELERWQLGALIVPVIWQNNAYVKTLSPEVMGRYSVIFPRVGIATSFKGVRNRDPLTNQITFYYENNKLWLKLVARYSNRIKFGGVIITGWQRYDHFSALCELLPVSIPSLVLNLLHLSTDVHHRKKIDIKVKKVCQCNFNPLKGVKSFGYETCEFPGSKVYITVLKLVHLMDLLQRIKDDSNFRGWFSSYNVKHAFSNPIYIENVMGNVEDIYRELISLEDDIIMALYTVYEESTVAEWLTTYVEPFKQELNKTLESGASLLSVQTWPKRPLSNN